MFSNGKYANYSKWSHSDTRMESIEKRGQQHNHLIQWIESKMDTHALVHTSVWCCCWVYVVFFPVFSLVGGLWFSIILRSSHSLRVPVVISILLTQHTRITIEPLGFDSSTKIIFWLVECRKKRLANGKLLLLQPKANKRPWKNNCRASVQITF